MYGPKFSKMLKNTDPSRPNFWIARSMYQHQIDPVLRAFLKISSLENPGVLSWARPTKLNVPHIPSYKCTSSSDRTGIGSKRERQATIRVRARTDSRDGLALLLCLLKRDDLPMVLCICNELAFYRARKADCNTCALPLRSVVFVDPALDCGDGNSKPL